MRSNILNMSLVMFMRLSLTISDPINLLEQKMVSSFQEALITINQSTTNLKTAKNTEVYSVLATTNQQINKTSQLILTTQTKKCSSNSLYSYETISYGILLTLSRRDSAMN